MSESENNTTATGEDAFPPAPTVDSYPLLATDPPKINGFWLDSRLVARAGGVVYLAHAEGQPHVMLLVLADGAAKDAAARDRLAGEVNRMHADTVVARGGQGQDDGRLAHLFRNGPDNPVAANPSPAAPWVALAWDDSPAALAEADRLLRTVDLSGTSQLGNVAGPAFTLPWAGNSRPGVWRSWPMPWPGHKDRASWVPLLASWLLMVLLGSLALLIAVLIFQNRPPESPSAPVTGSSTSSESSPQSGSPSPNQSESPSGSGSQSGSPSQSESPTPSGSESDSQSASPSESSGQPSSPGSHDSPVQTPSMGAPGSGTATTTQTPTNPESQL
ncbi:hypothetical protein [Propionibacterium sp.]|uniref:hypothetical protein n=1 Tax=Propionibacterium sp. TaxID=1977903 RepID=UPI0039EB5E93